MLEDQREPSTATVADLDAPGLDVALCRPLRAPGAAFTIGIPTVVYRRPHLAVGRPNGWLTLQRCGHAAARVTRCVGSYGDVVLTAVVLAWTDARDRVHLLPHRGDGVL